MRCAQCKGKGNIPVITGAETGEETQEFTICPACNGTGRINIHTTIENITIQVGRGAGLPPIPAPGWSPAKFPGESHETARAPFLFRTGRQAWTFMELLRLCDEDMESGVYHFSRGHFEPWLVDLGRSDLAALVTYYRCQSLQGSLKDLMRYAGYPLRDEAAGDKSLAQPRPAWDRPFSTSLFSDPTHQYNQSMRDLFARDRALQLEVLKYIFLCWGVLEIPGARLDWFLERLLTLHAVILRDAMIHELNEEAVRIARTLPRAQRTMLGVLSHSDYGRALLQRLCASPAGDEIADDMQRATIKLGDIRSNRQPCDP